MKKTIIHLLSGGLDSVTMLYHLVGDGHSVHCVLFDYGQKHSQELTFAKIHCHRLNVMFTTITLQKLMGSSLTDSGTSWVVPFRNAILISHSVNIAVAAGADTITVGCNKDDEHDFPDCRKGFLDAVNETIKQSGYNIEVCAPFIDKPKWWIAALAQELGVSISEIWTCYNGGSKPCGECPACVKLKKSLL